VKEAAVSDATETEPRPVEPRPEGRAWERWLPRASAVAAFLTTLCCLGLSAAISLATALGATFMTRDSSLRPILAVTLLITVAASVLTLRRHHNPLPLVLTVAAGALVFWTLFGGGTGHAATPEHGGTNASAPATAHSDEHAAPTSAHSDEHATTGGHTDEHATTPADEHAAPAGDHSDSMAGEHSAGGGHGSTTDKVLVWVGLVVLVGAQVWDLLILRSRRRAAAA
jgi:MerC mercury resistance protein